MTIRILPWKGSPMTKLADAELLFDGRDGMLEGLKLAGFAIWESRGKRNVTFPARQYSVNGERRSFALLRPAAGDTTGNDRVKDAVLQAFIDYEQRRPDVVVPPEGFVTQVPSGWQRVDTSVGEGQ